MFICFTWQAMRIVLEKGHSHDQVCKPHRAYGSQQQHSRNFHRVIIYSRKFWRRVESFKSCSFFYLIASGHQWSIFKSIQTPLRTAGAHSYILMLGSKSLPSDLSQCLTQLRDGYTPVLDLLPGM